MELEVKLQLPYEVDFLIGSLNKRGHEAFVVGGCVRDSLMKRTPNDWDICTSATPDQIKETFSQFDMILSGEKHGTVVVLWKDDDKTQHFDITTYRIDGEYSDGRRPDEVVFTSHLEDDLSRRDFTINAMAYNHSIGLVDPFKGFLDLRKLLLRTVGDPLERFKEDGLRILRALRFAGKYQMTIDPATRVAILDNVELLDGISMERIQCELDQILMASSSHYILPQFRVLFNHIIPTLEDYSDRMWKDIAFACQRASYHTTDIAIGLAIILGDIDNDPQVAAKRAKDILRFMKYPNKVIDKTSMLIHHRKIEFENDKVAIKRILQSMGDFAINHYALKAIECTREFNGTGGERIQEIEAAIDTTKAYLNGQFLGEAYNLRTLNFNGQDLIQLGVEPEVRGTMLHVILENVILGILPNDHDVIFKFISDPSYYPDAVWEISKTYMY